MNIAAAQVDYFQGWRVRSQSSTEFGNAVPNGLRDWKIHRNATVTFGLNLLTTLNELRDVATEYDEPNWDGYDAYPVSPATVQTARGVVESLPYDLPKPSVGAEPDGQLTIEWYRSPYKQINISISADGDLHYAAMIGASRAYGTEHFYGEFPRDILALIRRVCAE
ncbi:MAG: hypothetical protein ACREBC_01790 [Pyrinomonadaceae bacterium]